MGALETLGATLVVAASWFVGLVLVVGLGRAVSVVFGWRSGAGAELFRVHAWIGISVLIAYLQVWHLITPIGPQTWVLPGVAAAIGWSRRMSIKQGSSSLRSRKIWASAAACLVVLVLANLALGSVRNFDSGLYHLALIEWVSAQPVTPGLGNLHVRFGQSVPILDLSAFAGVGPWAGAGYRLVNGFIVAVFVVDVLSRLVEGPWSRLGTRVAPLLLVGVLLTSLINPPVLLSSPDLDLPALVLVSAGSLLLIDSITTGKGTHRQMLAVSSVWLLAAIAMSRPLYAVFVVGAVIAVTLTTPAGERSLSGLVRLVAFPITAAAFVVLHNVLLSGYPFFPAPVLRLPLEWTVSTDAIQSNARLIASWARAPTRDPEVVLASWDWLGPWISAQVRNPVVMLALFLGLGGLLTRLLLRSTSMTDGVEDRRDATARRSLLGVCAVALAVWFVTAPDPRFALAPLWIAAAVLAAPDSRAVSGASRWAVWAPLVSTAVVALAVAGPSIRFVAADGTGPFGSHPAPQANTTAVRLDSGLVIKTPADGLLCWRERLCSPYGYEGLATRSNSPKDGFVTHDR